MTSYSEVEQRTITGTMSWLSRRRDRIRIDKRAYRLQLQRCRLFGSWMPSLADWLVDQIYRSHNGPEIPGNKVPP